jgi:hypothetical protein
MSQNRPGVFSNLRMGGKKLPNTEFNCLENIIQEPVELTASLLRLCRSRPRESPGWTDGGNQGDFVLTM